AIRPVRARRRCGQRDPSPARGLDGLLHDRRPGRRRAGTLRRPVVDQHRRRRRTPSAGHARGRLLGLWARRAVHRGGPLRRPRGGAHRVHPRRHRERTRSGPSCRRSRQSGRITVKYGVISRTLHALGARDPARERLRTMLAVTTGILLSVLWGHGVIHVLHADSGLLAMSMFLSLMSGLFVKDSTAPARILTTGLLIPTLVLVPLLATALHSQRYLLLTVFVLISGTAVWARRFGARATAVGTLTFFAYFFTLFMHPTPKELPAFCLIAAGAAGTQFLMKLLMWLGRHPERELGVLLRELRVATAAALDSASSPAHERALAHRLERVDTMWRAITGWQRKFRTETFTNWDADTLALCVMDACVHTEEACRQLALRHG